MTQPFNVVEGMDETPAPAPEVTPVPAPIGEGQPVEYDPRALHQVEVVDATTGAPTFLSPEDATQAFKAGQVRLPAGGALGFADADGVMRTGSAQDADDAVAKGGYLVPHIDAHREELAREYSGAKGGAIAFGAGVGRGATVGLSDAAIGMFGDDAKEAIEASNEEHPWLRTGGEFGGMALGSAFVPGMGAAESLGEAGGEGLAALSGGALTTKAAGFGARTLARTAKSSLSGLGYGLQGGIQNLVSEEALHSELDTNPELSGEQIVASLGHDALLGAVFGGLAGAGTEALVTGTRAATSALAPKLEQLANREMWRDLNSGKGITKQVMARVEGGTEAIGATARAIGLDDPRLSVAEQLAKATDAKGTTGSEIGDMYRRSGAMGTAGDLVKRLDGLIDDAGAIAGNESTVNALKDYRASLLDKLTKEAVDTGAAEAPAAVVPPDPREKAILDEIERLRVAGAPAKQLEDLEAMRMQMFGPRAPAPAAGPAKGVLDAPIPLAEMWKQRVGLNRLVYQEAKALDPKLRVELLRTFSGRFSDYLEEAGEKSAKESGEEFAAPLRKLNQRYQHLNLIEDSLEEKVARDLTNRRHSLTDSIMTGGGISGGGALLASGHPLAAAAAMVGGFANKFLREKGPQLAAYALGHVGSLEGVAQHVQSVDALVTRAATDLAARKSPNPALPAGAIATKRSVDEARDTYEAKAGMVRELADHPELASALDEHFAPVAKVAPKTAAAATQAAKARVAYLAKTLPPPLRVDPLRPEMTTPPSLGEQQRWLRRYEATPERLAQQIGSLHLDPLTIETMRETSPLVFQRFVSAVHGQLAEKPESFGRTDRLSLGMLTGAPLTTSATPAGFAARQQTYAPKAPQQQGMGQGTRGGTALTAHGTSVATASEQIAKGD